MFFKMTRDGKVMPLIELAKFCLECINDAEKDGVKIDDGNVVDLIADNSDAPLDTIRAALVVAGLSHQFPNATSCRMRNDADKTDAAYKIDCPKCGQSAGEPCKITKPAGDKGRIRKYPHIIRKREQIKRESACPNCGKNKCNCRASEKAMAASFKREQSS